MKHPDLCRLAEPRLGRRVEFEELLGAADIAISSTSSADSILPLALCMAAGLPVVATENPALRELLDNDKTAFTTPAKSVRLLAQAHP